MATPKPSYKEREKQRREQEILDNAQQILNEKGINSLNMDELAVQVGISKPTLYNHFKSKEELILRILVRDFEQVEEQMTAPFDGSAFEQIHYLFRQMLVRRAKTHNLYMHMSPEIIELIKTNPDLQACRTRMHEHWDRVITAAKAEGKIKSDFPNGLIIRTMIGLGWVLQEHFQQYPLLAVAESPEANIEFLMQLLFEGIASPKQPHIRRGDCH